MSGQQGAAKGGRVSQREGNPNTCMIVGGIGCLSVVVLLVLVGTMVYFGAKSAVKGIVDSLTEAQPVELPQVEMSEEEYQALQERVKTFWAALEADSATEPLVLTADDLNALIAYHPDWQVLRGMIYITIEEQQIAGEVSVPLEKLPWDLEMLKGRYFNGKVGLNVFLHGDMLFVGVKSAEFKGQPLPQETLSQIQQENMAKDLMRDKPELEAMVQKLKSIEVSDGKVTITPKVTVAPASPSEGPPSAPTLPDGASEAEGMEGRGSE